ncbi:hypothetical protein [Ignatzschineria cameli]|nr:hypothetical protein [Ignatzschineria cameli]
MTAYVKSMQKDYTLTFKLAAVAEVESWGNEILLLDIFYKKR